MRTALQIIGEYSSSADAQAGSAFQRIQDGFIAGRILAPSAGKPSWRAQSFHDAGGMRLGDWAPDDSRVVVLPDSVLAVCKDGVDGPYSTKPLVRAAAEATE